MTLTISTDVVANASEMSLDDIISKSRKPRGGGGRRGFGNRPGGSGGARRNAGPSGSRRVSLILHI